MWRLTEHVDGTLEWGRDWLAERIARIHALAGKYRGPRLDWDEVCDRECWERTMRPSWLPLAEVCRRLLAYYDEVRPLPQGYADMRQRAREESILIDNLTAFGL